MSWDTNENCVFSILFGRRFCRKYHSCWGMMVSLVGRFIWTYTWCNMCMFECVFVLLAELLALLGNLVKPCVENYGCRNMLRSKIRMR